MNEKTTYGHRRFWFWFKPLLTISDKNFEFCSKLYRWDEILKIKSYDMWSVFSREASAPYSYISLKDGSEIIIRGRSLEKSGEKPKVYFFRCVSDAYDELMSLIREKTINH